MSYVKISKKGKDILKDRYKAGLISRAIVSKKAGDLILDGDVVVKGDISSEGGMVVEFGDKSTLTIKSASAKDDGNKTAPV